MAFRDVYAEGEGISIPQQKMDAMIAAKQLIFKDGIYARNSHRLMPTFEGVVDFLEDAEQFRAYACDGRVVLEPIAGAAPLPRGPAITAHAAEQWEARVEGVIGWPVEKLREIYDSGQPRYNPTDQSKKIRYVRTHGIPAPLGWIEFVVATDGAMRIVTVTSGQRFELKFSGEKRREMALKRLNRSRDLMTVCCDDGYLIAVPKGSDHIMVMVERMWTCTCRDFAYSAAPARLSCKHIWWARQQSGEFGAEEPAEQILARIADW